MSGRIICLERDIAGSTAFKKLSATAIRIYLLFLARRKMTKTGRRGKGHWTIANNGDIVFPYAEAAKKYKISRSQFARCISKLVEVGFLDIARLGGGYNGDCTKYALSERWRDYGKKQFAKKSRPKDTRRGFGFTSENWEERTGRHRKPKQKEVSVLR